MTTYGAKMGRLLILHHLPLEYYPPVKNLIEDFVREPGLFLRVIAARSPAECSPYSCRNVRIFRTPRIPRIPGSALVSQFLFLVIFVKEWILHRPSAILYFEPHSALPAILLRWWPGKKAPIFVHHHEYYAAGDLGGKGGRIPQVLQRLEAKMVLPFCAWFSQTNGERLRRYLADHNLVQGPNWQILPNYPPRSWASARNRAWLSGSEKLRVVHVGSLSPHATFFEPALRWIAKNPENLELDIFALHPPKEVAQFIRELEAPNVRYHPEGIDYQDLPERLVDFHAGLILYRGNSLNFIYNQPNKLFEYLTCGLDVWYPAEMEGIAPLRRENAFPRILPFHFDHLDSIDLRTLRRKPGIPEAHDTYSADRALAPLKAAILNSIPPDPL